MSECSHVVQNGGRGCSCTETRARIAELEAALKQAYDDVDAFAEKAGITMRVNRAALKRETPV